MNVMLILSIVPVKICITNLIQDELVDEAGNANVVNIRRKRGWVKETVEEVGKLVYRSKHFFGE